MPQLDFIKSKILSGQALERELAYWRFQDRKIVFTNGCSDILHLGHIDYLSKAADLGNILIIGVNTDASVSRIKGPHRPLQDQESRAMVLASLKFVNAVVLFDEDTPFELIHQIQPDILVKGADYKPEAIVGYDIVMSKGGKVVTIDFLPGHSTSAIEQRIIENCKPGHS
jgi:D-glycero-beta-D-manno-heptose 1-phosphate adenylyltransferase